MTRTQNPDGDPATSRERHAPLLVIGAGPGGYVAAIRAAQRGLSTTVVESAELGGVCLNEGCVPSKALIHGAYQHARARTVATGTALDADTALRDIQRRKAAVVSRLRDGVGVLLESHGVEVLRGTARLVGPHRAGVATGDGDIVVDFDHAILAAGSTATPLDVLPFDGERVVSAREALELEAVPPDVVIVGAGYIGLELACALHHLGAAVRVVEIVGRVLPGLHEGLASELERSLRRRGLELLLGHTVVADTGTGVRVKGPDGERELPARTIIVAVGRRPRSAELGLEAAGIATDARGLVPVDEQRRTDVPHIFAIGDLTEGPALAHKAMREGQVAADAAAGLASRFEPAGIPAVAFTEPEVATVGLTLEQARDRGLDAAEVRFPFAANARSLTVAGGTGSATLVFDESSGLVLGLHLIGSGSGELIGTGALALEMGAVVEDLAGTVFPHPTLSEAMGELGELALGHPVHVRASARPRPRQSR